VGHTPYLEQWNLTVQREVMHNTIATLGYVGSRGVHLIVMTDENPPIPDAQLAPDGNQVFSHLRVVNGRTSIVSNPLMNPNFGYLDAQQTFGWSKYNALQAGLTRRMTNNWQMQFSYTYSECMDIGSAAGGLDGGSVLENPYNNNQDKGWCIFMIRHNAVFNSVYVLPFHNHRLLTGWQVGGVMSYHSGTPIFVTDGFTHAFQNGTNANRPNLVSGCNQVNDTIRRPNGVFWLNTACYTLPPVGELGNLSRDPVFGPDAATLDASLQKTTKISERYTVQFRAEFFNVLNRANFRNPSGAIFSQGLDAGGNATGGGTPGPTAGQITLTNTTARQIQFGLKFLF
jgi:hypothetical protein